MSDGVLLPPLTFIEIPVAPGYDAGSDGHVYSRRTKGRVGLRPWRAMLREKTDKHGYKEVTIYNGNGRRSFKVHQLILSAFQGPCPPGMMACHFPDHDRTNNVPGNLMWGTGSTNQLHRREQGTAAWGEKNVKAKLSPEEVADIRRIYESGGVTQEELAARFGVYQSTIGRLVRGDTWPSARPKRSYQARCGPGRKRASGSG